LYNLLTILLAHSDTEKYTILAYQDIYLSFKDPY